MSTETLSNPIAEMSTKRIHHAAVALNDHQCVVMGGGYQDFGMVGYPWQYLSSAELYNKTTNTWTKLPDMRKKRCRHAAAVVGNVVYAIGGWDGKRYLSSVEVLDFNKSPEQQREWVVLEPTMTTGHIACGAAVVGQKIYVLGGWDGTSLHSIEIFDTELQYWSMGPSASAAGQAIVAIGTTICAIGGHNKDGEMLDTVECFNVHATGNNGKWTLLPEHMFITRWSPAVTVIGGCIFVIGGYTRGNFTTPEFWDPKNQMWRSLPKMNAREGCAAVTLGTSVLVMGGTDPFGLPLSSGVLLYSREILSASIPFPASSHSSPISTLTCDAMDDNEKSLAEQSLVSKPARTANPSMTRMPTKTLPHGWEVDATWSPVAKMSETRTMHSAVALNDHQCVVIGGGHLCRRQQWVLQHSSVELYDKTTNRWTKLPDMEERRACHAAAVVGNLVYAIGGLKGLSCEQKLASVEVLDLNEPPEQWKWRVLNQTMTTGRCAAAIVGQKIYVMGEGDRFSRLSSVKIFDTETQEWSIGPSMTTARFGCAAVSVGSTVYAIGGQDNDDEHLDTVECLNVLATGNDYKWIRLPQSMSIKRHYPAAAVIGDCIVVLGGCSTPSKTAELWDPKCQMWMLLPSMNTATMECATVALGTSVVVVGGNDATSKRLSSGERLHFTDMSRIQTRTELNTIITNLELALKRTRVNALYLPSRTSHQVVQSIGKELKAWKGFQEHIKNQLLAVREVHEDVESLYSMHNEQSRCLGGA